jgi:hypothetical protein
MAADRDQTALVASLAALTRQFSAAHARKKLRLLAALKSRPIHDGMLLRQLYDALCFMRAYPDDAALLGAVEDGLRTFPSRVKRLHERDAETGTEREAAALDDSGAAGTRVHTAFSLPMVRWLVERFPETVEIDWDEPETEHSLASVFSMCSGPVAEEPLFEADTAYRSWVQVHKGNRSISDLRWLLDLLALKMPEPVVQRAFYARLRLFVCWQLREGDVPQCASQRTAKPVHFQSAPLLKPGLELPHSLPGERVTVRAPAVVEARELITLARTAMAWRHRETHAFNYANPRDVQLAELGHGLQIVWMGVLPQHRLPLRALFGFLILKNGTPIGYGDAALLFDWIEGGGGISIFDNFRQGEAVFIFHRYTAFVHQHLGVRAMHISRWDIGHNNPEGIESRAFWFYYRLGFRPKDEGLQRLAAREFGRMKAGSGYRTPPKTLEKLSQSGMFLSLTKDSVESEPHFQSRRVTQKAEALVAQVGLETLTAQVAERLGLESRQSWSPSEHRAFARWAPVLALIDDLPCWPASERRAIVSLVRAKAGRSEIEYLRRLAARPRLRAAILALGA